MLRNHYLFSCYLSLYDQLTLSDNKSYLKFWLMRFDSLIFPSSKALHGRKLKNLKGSAIWQLSFSCLLIETTVVIKSFDLCFVLSSISYFTFCSAEPPFEPIKNNKIRYDCRNKLIFISLPTNFRLVILDHITLYCITRLIFLDD